MPTLYLDFETRSTLNIEHVGAHIYAAHASTSIWCAAFAINNSPVKLWLPGMKTPDAIRRAVLENWIITAHNATFERLIWRHKMTPQYHWSELAPGQFRCTMVAARAAGLPGGLEGVTVALGSPYQKDAEGQRLMKQMARPRKPRPGEDPNGVYWHDEPEK
jgi:DNA polymerase